MRSAGKHGLRTGVALVLTAALGACGDTLDNEAVDAASDALEGVGELHALVALVADPAGAMGTAEMAASASAAGASARLQPVRCVTTAVQGATVTLTMAGCFGPYGLANMDGTLQATFSDRSADGWSVALSGDVRLLRSRLRPDARARVRYVGGTRVAEVTATGSGTGPRGVSFANTGSYTSSWDGECYGLDGSMVSTADGAQVVMTVSAYRRCRGECPQAGGTLALSTARGETLRVVYRGGAVAEVTGPRGVTRMVELFCRR